MPFSAAGGGVGSEGEGGGRLRWGRRERSLIIRGRRRSCGGPGEQRPPQAGGGRAALCGRGQRGPPSALRAAALRAAALRAAALLPRIAHLRARERVRTRVSLCVCVSVCVYVRSAARCGAAGRSGAAPCWERRERREEGSRAWQFGRAGAVPEGPAARVCHRCQVLEAEIGGVAERSCGGASEEWGRHRLLLRSAFFLIASGEAAGRAGLTFNSYHLGNTHLTVSHPNEKEIAEQTLLITKDLHLALPKSPSHESVSFDINGCREEGWIQTLTFDPKPALEASSSNEILELDKPSSCVNLSLNWR
ncbi:uncharacterized protein ACIQIH_003573 [Cyanocitta cristata]